MTRPDTLKLALFKQCETFVDEQIKTVQAVLADIKVDLESETKSSAGDKHETGRAMLQLEREKAGAQLAEKEKLRENLSKIDILKSAAVISLGSIVFTSKYNYYISISAGEIKQDSDSFYAISPNTPMGKALVSKKIGDSVCFRDQVFVIEHII